MRVKIKDVAYYMPGEMVPNDDLKSRKDYEGRPWDVDGKFKATGIEGRYFANKGDQYGEGVETALDLAYEACLKLFEANEGLRKKVDGLIFVPKALITLCPPIAVYSRKG